MLKLLIARMRQKNDDMLWKPDDLQMSRRMKAEIMSCKQSFKDDDKKKRKTVQQSVGM